MNYFYLSVIMFGVCRWILDSQNLLSPAQKRGHLLGRQVIKIETFLCHRIYLGFI